MWTILEDVNPREGLHASYHSRYLAISVDAGLEAVWSVAFIESVPRLPSTIYTARLPQEGSDLTQQ